MPRKSHGHFACKLKPWTREEIEDVRTRYRIDGPRAIAARLGRPADSIRSKAFLMGLSTPREAPTRPWSEGEVLLLRRTYPDVGPTRLGKTLGRTPESVGSKAMELGIATLAGSPRREP